MVSFAKFRTTISLLFGSCLALSPQPSRQERGSFGSFSRVIQLPPLTSTDGKYAASIPVCYTNAPDSIGRWLGDHISSDGATIGFDLESVPNLPWLKTKFQGPATVQIAVPSAAIVVQLVDNKGNPSAATASILQTVLADQSIVKAGVGIDQDMLELYREWGCTFDIKNRFDIGGIGATNSQTLSLKNLTQAIVNVELQKSRKLAMSNWGQVPLTEAQISYCARDAWAAAVIMTELAERDPDTFATAPLIHRLSNEVCIEDLDKRAKGRKAAKTRFIEIVGKGADKVPLQDLSGPLRKEVGELEEVMRALAPPTPFRFDMSLLECDLN